MKYRNPLSQHLTAAATQLHKYCKMCTQKVHIRRISVKPRRPLVRSKLFFYDRAVCFYFSRLLVQIVLTSVIAVRFVVFSPFQGVESEGRAVSGGDGVIGTIRTSASGGNIAALNTLAGPAAGTTARLESQSQQQQQQQQTNVPKRSGSVEDSLRGAGGSSGSVGALAQPRSAPGECICSVTQ